MLKRGLAMFIITASAFAFPAASSAKTVAPDIGVAMAYVGQVTAYQRLSYAVMSYQRMINIAAYQSAMDAEAYQDTTNQSSPSMSTGRTSGGHSDAWWQGVAQCEQGGRNDSYFGYFSFMDGSQGGRPWADQVAAGNSLLSQYAERESQGGAWADSCIDSGYNASPGG